MKNYYYPFSQWAVFTEYGLRDVAGFGLLAKTEYQIANRLATSIELDFLRVDAENSQFNYIFYSWNVHLPDVKRFDHRFLSDE